MRSENHFFYPEIIMICIYSLTRAQNTPHTHTHTHTLLKLRKPGWGKQLKQTSVISWGSKWEKMT